MVYNYSTIQIMSSILTAYPRIRDHISSIFFLYSFTSCGFDVCTATASLPLIIALQLLYDDMGGLQPPHSQERQLLIYEYTIWQIQCNNPRKDIDIHIYSIGNQKPTAPEYLCDKTVVVVVISCKTIRTHLSPFFLSVLSFFCLWWKGRTAIISIPPTKSQITRSDM